MTATKETFFKPEKVSPQDKAATTDSVARSLIAQEATARDRKTEALKALRLEREAEENFAAAARRVLIGYRAFDDDGGQRVDLIGALTGQAAAMLAIEIKILVQLDEGEALRGA